MSRRATPSSSTRTSPALLYIADHIVCPCESCPANTVLPFVRAKRGQTPNKDREFAACDIIHDDGQKCPIFRWKWPNRAEDPALNPFVDPLLPPDCHAGTFSQLSPVDEMEETMLATAIAASLQDQNHVPSPSIHYPPSSFQATSSTSSLFTSQQSSSFTTRPLQTARNSNVGQSSRANSAPLSPPLPSTQSVKTRLICSEPGCIQSGNTKCVCRTCKSHCLRKGGCRQHPGAVIPSSSLPPSYTQATIPASNPPLPIINPTLSPLNDSQETHPHLDTNNRAPKFFTPIIDSHQQSAVQQARDEHRESALASKAARNTLRSSLMVYVWTSEDDKPDLAQTQVSGCLSGEALTISQALLDSVQVCDHKFEYYRPQECKGLEDFLQMSKGPGQNIATSRLLNPPPIGQCRKELKDQLVQDEIAHATYRHNSHKHHSRSRHHAPSSSSRIPTCHSVSPAQSPTHPSSQSSQSSQLSQSPSRHSQSPLQHPHSPSRTFRSSAHNSQSLSRHSSVPSPQLSKTPPPPLAQERNKISPLSNRFTASPSPDDSTIIFPSDRRDAWLASATQKGYTVVTKWPSQYFSRDIIDFYRDVGDIDDPNKSVKATFGLHFPLVSSYPRALVYSHYYRWKDAPQELLDRLYIAGPSDDARWTRLMKVVPDRYQALRCTRKRIKRDLDREDRLALAAAAAADKKQEKKGRGGRKLQLDVSDTSNSSLGSDDSIVREVRRLRK
ncbi:hypothetical protein PM082_024035 [Marasmius tenuissimus]|nr:hypothetical protein PM082_024035 [Marasmius tenuissimus]